MPANDLVERPGCEHTVLVHQGVDDLSRRLAPNLQRAASEGAAVLLCLDEPTEARVRSDVGSICDGFTFRRADLRYATPGVAMSSLHAFLVDAATSGAPTAWSIGSIPLGHDRWDARWMRYEAAVMSVLADQPLRAVCLYDADTTPTWLRQSILDSHQSFDGEWISDHEHPPSTNEWPLRDADLVIRDLMPHDIRASLASRFSDLVPSGALADLQLVATELITNSIIHGAPPVELRAWGDEGGCVVEVHDRGTRTIDPHAHFRRCVGGAHGGFGLWTVGQIATSVEITRTNDGNVVTAFVASRPDS